MKLINVVLTSTALSLTGALLPAAQPSTSAPAQQAAPLSLRQCIDTAAQNQVDITVARNNVVAAQARSTQAKSAYYPQASIQNNAFNVGAKGVLTQKNIGTALTVTQNIYDGGIRDANVAGSRYGVTSSRFGLVRTTQTVVFDVTTAYYQVLRSKHLADVSQANVNYNDALLKQIQARVNVGDAAQADVLPIEAQLATAKVGLISAQNAVQVSIVQLQNTMGLSPRSGFDIQDVTAAPTPTVGPVDTYVATALASRPDVVQSQANLGVAKEGVKAARIPLYPVPEISAEYQHGVGGLHGTSSQITGGFSFDIFNGGANRAALRLAEASRATAQAQYEQVSKDIESQVEQAYLNLNDAKERLSASQVGYDSAQKNYDVQVARYGQGLAIPLDLLNAEVQVVTAQTNLVQARYDFYTAIAQMDFAVGKQGGFNAGP